MKIEWNEVTWYSKFAAVVFFLIVLPIAVFFLGRAYESVVSKVESTPNLEKTGITNKEPTSGKINDRPIPATISGVRGLVTVGPVCTSEQIENNNCAEKPLSTLVAIENNQGEMITETVSSGDGSFFIELEPGEYVVKLMTNEEESLTAGLNAQPVSVSERYISSVFFHIDRETP